MIDINSHAYFKAISAFSGKSEKIPTVIVLFFHNLRGSILIVTDRTVYWGDSLGRKPLNKTKDAVFSLRFL